MFVQAKSELGKVGRGKRKPVDWSGLKLGLAFSEDGHGAIQPRVISAQSEDDFLSALDTLQLLEDSDLHSPIIELLKELVKREVHGATSRGTSSETKERQVYSARRTRAA